MAVLVVVRHRRHNHFVGVRRRGDCGDRFLCRVRRPGDCSVCIVPGNCDRRVCNLGGANLRFLCPLEHYLDHLLYL